MSYSRALEVVKRSRVKPRGDKKTASPAKPGRMGKHFILGFPPNQAKAHRVQILQKNISEAVPGCPSTGDRREFCLECVRQLPRSDTRHALSKRAIVSGAF